MPAKSTRPEPYVHRHRDGSIWAKGQMLGGKMTGYWEWFRKDGTKLRSGWFDDGKQVGRWTTYDAKGKVYKITEMTRKAAAKAKAEPKSKPKLKAKTKRTPNLKRKSKRGAPRDTALSCDVAV